MKPLLTNRDSLHLRNTAEQIGASYRQIALCYPSKVAGTNYDEFEDSPEDITGSDTTGQAVTWKVQWIHGRLATPSFTELSVGQAGVGYLVGDLKLYFKKTDIDSVKRIIEEADAFIYVDGNAYKPYGGLTMVGMFETYEVHATLRKITPRVKPAGFG